ncbi:MAG TPA: hypothetical protein PKC76_18455 [Saprospiraceae bacterium]|nr:hypothetical protein [Saprospiraceae bacterium]
MIKELNISQEWLTRRTGDPFADIGGLVIEYLQQKNPGKSIFDLIKETTYTYVNQWNNNLHSFFLNSTITHNSSKGQKGIDKTLAYFNGLLIDKDTYKNEYVEPEEGYCRITGQKGKVFNGGRDNHVMSGSGTLINFHHGFESGIRLSKEALIRIFFLPLGVEQLGDKVAVLISNNDDVTRYFVRQNVDNNFRDIGSNISKSIQCSDFNNPANALFDYADQCIQNVKTATYNEEIGRSNTRGVTLNLFHFTNFGASPTIKLYTIPATVFAFYAYCLTEHQKEWKRFIYQHFSSSKFKNAQYNEATSSWTNSKDIADYGTFKTWRNVIFENLLKNQSLLRYFLYYSKKNQINFKIVEQYQINIHNMDKRTLTKIKGLADFIILNRSDDEIKKSITRLNGTKSSHDIRYFLLKLTDQNYKEGNREPLFTLDEYVEYLFPDGVSWREIRDLLIIAIYQKLHEANKKIEVELQENQFNN